MIRFKLDSGAQVNTLSLAIVEKYNWTGKMEQTNIKLNALGDFEVKPVAVLEIKIHQNNISRDIAFYIVKNEIAILGLPACVELNCVQRVDALETVKLANKNL